MSLQALVDAIRAEGAAAAARIAAQAEEQAAAIENEAVQNAAQVRAQAAAAALQPLSAERKPLLLQAQMDATRSWEAARAVLVETALAATTKQLRQLREREDYRQLLARLLREAVAALDVPGPLRVEVDPRDEALVRELIAADDMLADRPHSLVPRLHTGGGLCVATPDGALRVNNTVETRLDRVLPQLRTQLGLLFSSDGEHA